MLLPLLPLAPLLVQRLQVGLTSGDDFTTEAESNEHVSIVVQVSGELWLMRQCLHVFL
jgi:hypothetical protein